MGGKTRQSSAIRRVVEDLKGLRTDYVEPFLGGGSVLSSVASLFESQTAGDVVPELVSLWQDVKSGWVPPATMTKEQWDALRLDPAPSGMKGWAAYAASYNGKYFAGYGPVASGRDYLAESQRAILKKAQTIPETTAFVCCDYSRHHVTSNTVVYCDPPYADTETYQGAGSFDHSRFWTVMNEWADCGALVLVHEYSAPDGWTPVLVADRVETMNHSSASSGARQEKLFVRQNTDRRHERKTVTAQDFFAKPDYPAREPKRPKIVDPGDGAMKDWQRASNFAALLDSPFGLITHQLRELVKGLARRPDLTAMIRARVPLEDDAKGKIDEIIAGAHAAAAIDAKANNGTAIHAALVQSRFGSPHEVPEEFHPHARGFARCLRENGLTCIAAEQSVLSLKWKSPGTRDYLFQELDGSFVVGDVKTGRLDTAKRKFAVQCEVYAEAEYLVHPDGTTEPMPWEIRRDYAVLIHVDPETGECSAYKLDLHIGRVGAALAEQVRRWHTIDPLLPYVPPVAGELLEITPQAVAETESAESARLMDESNRAQAFGHYGPTDEDRATESSTQIPGVAVDLQPVDFDAPDAAPAFEAADVLPKPEKPYDVDARFAELMKSYDKAQLQGILKRQHNWSDSNHNRRWLARAIVVLEQGWTDAKAVVKYASAKDDTITPTPAELQEAREEEQTIDRRTVALEAIAGADSVAALASLNKHWVERYGDAAWTDELTAAAKARTAELDAATGDGPSEALQREQVAFRKIAEATAPDQLASLWEFVTAGGSLPEAWTPKLDVEAKAQLEKIRASAPPPPANPFG
jgi:DNA adenine methylase